MGTMLLPWQVDHAKRLLGDTGHLPHALLIHGIAGSGKREFALALAATLLCEDRVDGLACGKCQSCIWVAAGNHPDLKLVRPEAVAVQEGAVAQVDEDGEASPEAGAAKRKHSEEIKIDQIRALEAWYHRSTHRAGWRIVVLYPADTLSVVSANALLKALEEPPPETLFLLTSNAPDRLLPTIVSRCQKFALGQPSKIDCEQWLTGQGVKSAPLWLAAAGGAPLAALEMSQSLQSACPDWAQALIAALAKGHEPDLAVMADNLAKQNAGQWLIVMQRLAVDLGLACADLPVRYFPDLQVNFSQAAKRGRLSEAQALSGWINQQARLAKHPLSPKLFAQVCLQRFCDAVL
ncbi:DNA polymerase III subunit delta' [Orrella daihaiensis]|uniref:DNA polymerase III subunit delta n=1 Tax=Orrella daihaiensis TaxID=2782176 RepID=A0ABY4AGE7_9BURK|nr:DNA polymerase III subunit delta' [Orrella daihaiensis]UOD49351.1 DNA polymerase III subunit delta' [Orrella daihaiensis]